MIWVGLLHRCTLRGDFILTGHALGFTALYLVLGASSLSRIALKTSVEICAIYTTTLVLTTLAYRLSPWHPLASYPGPLLAKTTSLWLTYISSTGKRYLILDALHARYGPFLRIGTPLRAPESTLTWLMLTARRAKCSIHQLPKRNAALHQRGEERDVPVSRPPRRDGPVLQAGQRRRASRAETRLGPDVRARGVRAISFSLTVILRRSLRCRFLSSIADLVPQLERRTVQLLKTLERRQAATEKGFLDLSEAMYHWAHDFMVRIVRVCFEFSVSRVLSLNMLYRETWSSEAATNLCVARSSRAPPFLTSTTGNDEEWRSLQYHRRRKTRDGHAGHVSVSRPVSRMRDADGSWVSLGQSPWLLDILWHLPLTARMRAHEKNAAEMMRNRVEAVDLPGYRDLSSYLVSSLLFRMFSALID